MVHARLPYGPSKGTGQGLTRPLLSLPSHSHLLHDRNIDNAIGEL